MNELMTWPILLFATILAFTIIDKTQRYFTSQRQLKQCSTLANNKETIFVAINNFSGSVAGGRALFSLFEHAKCPFRVKVGIYEASYMPRAAAVMYYESLQKRFSISDNVFSQNIKSISKSSRERGTYMARQIVMETAYGGEAFILTIHDGVEMMQNWDEILIKTYLHMQSTMPTQNTVIVAPPAPLETLSSLSFGWLGLSSQEKLLPRFPIVGSFSEGGLPIHTSRAFLGKTSNNSAQKSLLWTSACSFSPASFFVDSTESVLDSNVMENNFHHAIQKRILPSLFQEDTLITCDGMVAGWTYVCSPSCVSRLYYDPDYSVISTRSGIPLEDIDATNKKVRDTILHKELGPYLHEIGLFKKPAPKAFTGVVDASNEAEIASKHGLKTK